MKNLLTILLTCSCNKACPHCVIERWRKPLDYTYPESEDLEQRIKDKQLWGETYGYPLPIRANMLTNERLLAWLDKYVPSNEWYIELTGGEPGLYPEIASLVPALNDRRYKGIIRTNGSLPIPKSDGFHLIAGWHGTADTAPEYYDVMLILKDDEKVYKQKTAYCKVRDIPYLIIHPNEGQEYQRQIEKIENWAYLNSVGQLSACPKSPCKEELNIFNLRHGPVVCMDVHRSCPHCVNVTGFEFAYEKAAG